MDKKNLKIDSEIHSLLSEESHKFNMTKTEYAEACISFFVKERIDPRKPVRYAEMRDVLISFIREQEKIFLLPIKNQLPILLKGIEDIQHDVKAIKTHIKDTK